MFSRMVAVVLVSAQVVALFAVGVGIERAGPCDVAAAVAADVAARMGGVVDGGRA